MPDSHAQGSTIGEAGYPVWALMVSGGILAAFVVAAVTDNHAPPKYHAAYGYLGFAVSVAWIYVVANEIVNVLQVSDRLTLSLSPS